MDQAQERLLRKHGDSDIRTDQADQKPDVVLDAGGFFGGPVHGCVEAFARSATQQSSCDTAPMKKGVANLKKYRQTTKNTRKYKNDDKGQNAIRKTYSARSLNVSCKSLSPEADTHVPASQKPELGSSFS
jgi:hypothetical protein